MNRLLEYRYLVRRNIFMLIGVSLCFYFSYHLVQGERSYLRLISLEKKIEKLSTEYASLKEKRTALEEKVIMLRPDSINKDLLEERVRHVLGFIHPDERILFDSGH